MRTALGRVEAPRRQMQPCQRGACLAGMVCRKERRPRLPVAIEVIPGRLAVQLVAPLALCDRAGAVFRRHDFRHAETRAAQMRHEGMFFREGFGCAQALVMALEEELAPLGFHQHGSGERAR
jgi:hypothetical protein